MREATDPDSDHDFPEWINLPLLMAQFADKSFAKYQLQLQESRKRLEKGKLSQGKFEAILKNGLRPFVLMNTTGQPATNAYIKTHLVQCSDGTMKLKDGGPGKH